MGVFLTWEKTDVWYVPSGGVEKEFLRRQHVRRWELLVLAEPRSKVTSVVLMAETIFP